MTSSQSSVTFGWRRRQRAVTCRSYARTGRIYTITVRISDRGQVQVDTTIVFVPPSRLW